MGRQRIAHQILEISSHEKGIRCNPPERYRRHPNWRPNGDNKHQGREPGHQWLNETQRNSRLQYSKEKSNLLAYEIINF